MNRATFFLYVILLWLIGIVGVVSVGVTLDRQTAHETSTTDDLAVQYPQ